MAPPWHRVVLSILTPLVMSFRAFFLYYRLPYDLSIWSKLKDTWYYIMTYIAASPNPFVRGGFFTIYLLGIITELEEFQVMRFIIGLKGTQFISGVIKTVILAFKFWKCAVTSDAQNGCRETGPGVGHT